ncbi:MAG: GHMP family kinase ATP-binding protein [Anaerolineae bacterium]
MVCEMQLLGRAAVPATCGELVQGSLDGIPCLVSCPIDVYSVATVQLDHRESWCLPAERPKSTMALQAGLRLWGVSSKGILHLVSPLPAGRGYGTSTADLGATLYALGRAYGRDPTPSEVARIAVSIEPSDSTLFPDLTLFAHRGGEFYETLAGAPPLWVIVIDPGGEVDTIAFNRRNHRAALRRLAREHYQAFDMLRQSLRDGDWEMLGEAAGLSARLHQSILFNPWLDDALRTARSVRALGVCRAHSGTLIGLLVDAAKTDIASVAAYVARRFPSLTVHAHRLVGGGPVDPGTLVLLPQQRSYSIS